MKGVLKMVYSWSYNKPVAAEVAGKRLEELTAIHGTVTPKIILEDSRDENAPLHPCFEWNDGKAAEAFRLQQAREILVCLQVTVESGEKEIGTRAFVNVADQDEKNGAFIAVGAALSKEETRQAVLTRALAEMTYFKRKYESLTELSEVFSSIDRAVKKIKKRSKKAA
jgi:hypothetical protein